MPKVVVPLTSTSVSNAKPKANEYNMADGQGLYLRVKPSGSKSWIYNYQSPYRRKRRNISLGQFPAVSLSQARSQRTHCRELLAQNTDPKEDRDKISREQTLAYSNTLKAVCDRWFEIKSSTISEGYAKDIYNSLANHVFPQLGNKPLHLITAPEAIDTLNPVAKRGNLELVKRLCQRLNMVLDYSVNTGVVSVNPLSGISKAFKPPKKVHYPTLRPEELPVLLHAIEASKVDEITYYLLYWQLHTMLRPSEAAGSRWDEIDFENKLWTIPAKRMKKKRLHIVPLTRQMLEILEIMKSISGHREHVFPGRNNPRHHRHSEAVNTAIGRMGFKGKLVSHGLRSIASTMLNEKGFDERVVEKALAHVDKNETARAYNRAEYLQQRREILQHWSDFIDAAKNPRPGNVMTLPVDKAGESSERSCAA